MINANNYYEKEALQEFYSYLNQKIDALTSQNKKYIVAGKGKGKGNDKLLFVNDPIFKFISQMHFVRQIDIDNSEKPNRKPSSKNKDSNRHLTLPKLKETYLQYEGKESYIKTNEIEFDPFYVFWVEQINLYFQDLKLLTDEYFDLILFNGINTNKFKPVDYFIYFNEKIIKLKRRATLINILLESNPSIIYQLIKEDDLVRKAYISVRCNWIDDCGDIDRNILIKVSEEFVENKIQLNVTDDIFKQIIKKEGLINLLSSNYHPLLFVQNLHEILGEFGFDVVLRNISNNPNNKNRKSLYLHIDGNDVEFNLTASNLTLTKVLSIMEFGHLYVIFKEIYNENGLTADFF